MEVVEGEDRGDHGVIFKRIGSELPVVEGGFNPTTTIPFQALAISNKFGLTFFLHSEGFCLAKTQDLVQASFLANSDEEYNAKDKAIANVCLPCIQSLALSEDELVVAACTDDKVVFYSVPALLQKGTEGCQTGAALLKSLSISGDEGGIKMLAWNPGQRGVILVLSKGGKLRLGPFGEQHLKVVAEDVESVDWSPDGEFFCYITRDENIHIFHSSLSSSLSSRLPPEMFDEAKDGLQAYVDTLKWVRSDSILVSCVAKDVDDGEDSSWIFVLASNGGAIAEDLHNTKVLSFEGLFTSIDSSILHGEIGPYTLCNYISPWELLVVTSRMCVDDHISLLGWFEEHGDSEVYKFELVDDRFIPRIELQACGDDNCVVGLAVDTTTRSFEIPAPNGDSGEKLKPGPVLFCMTMEGNLSLFAIARMDNKGKNSEVLNTISELPEASKVLLYKHSDSKESVKLPLVIEVPDEKSKSSVSGLFLDGKASEHVSSPEKSVVTVPRVESKTSQQSEMSGLFSDGKASEHVSCPEKSVVTVPRVESKTSQPSEMGGLLLDRKASEHVSCPEKSVVTVPRVESKPSQHSQKLPTAQMEGASVQRPDSSKEPKRDEMQAGQRNLDSQRQVQVPNQVNNKSAASVHTKTSNSGALSEMESEFVRELNKVKEMTTEIERMMDFIEGKRKLDKGESEPFFTKAYVEEIERKTRTMYKQCENYQVQLLEQRRSIIDLRDESLQVDAWSVYVQSILEQAFDARYKDLWNKQTLHPELAGTRKRILQADQSLKQQIAELEEHIHTLELSEWQKKKQPRIPPALSERKNIRCIQSVYDTVNTQMAIAQQLARRLALQSEALKLPLGAKEEIESSVNTSLLKLQNMTLQEHHPGARTRACLSSSGPADFSPVRTTFKSSLQTPTKQMPPAGTRASLQDSTRRRRDSVDKLWVDVGAAKTTVKRAAPATRFNGLSSPLSKDVVQSKSTQSKDEPLYSGPRPAMAFSPAQLEEGSKQARNFVQFEREASSRANRRDIGTGQSTKQNMTQLAATTAVSTAWPSTTPQNSAQDQVPVGLKFMSQKTTEQGFQAAIFPKQGTYDGPTSIGSTTQNTIQLQTKPIQTPSSIDIGKREATKLAPPNREKGSHSSRLSSVASINNSEQKAVPTNVQSKASVKQQQGASENLFMPFGGGMNQNAFQMAGSNLIKSANLQAPSADTPPSTKPEVMSSDNTSAIEWSKGSSIGHTTKFFPGVSSMGVSTSSSIFGGNMAHSLSPQEQSSWPLQKESSPKSAGEGKGSSVFAPTNIAQPSPSEPTRQHWGFSSSETPSSSGLLTKPSNFMTTFSSVQGTSPASQSLLALSAASASSQTSPSLDVLSISLVKPSNVFGNTTVPTEKSLFPSTTSVSASFLPVQGPPPPALSDEEEMEEENNSIIDDFRSSSFAGFGLGISSSIPSQQTNPFGLQSSSSPATSTPSTPFGASSLWNQTSPSSSAGQLFKPASFSIPTTQSTGSSTASTLFGNTPTSAAGGAFSGHGGFGNSVQPIASFGNPTQPSSSGQQVLGNALGSFGQTRQIGGPFSASGSPSGFGLASGGGFASAATGGGFAGAATGGGFAGVASGGGFAGLAAGGGFASAATGGGFAGFSGAGVGGSASPNMNPGSFGAYGGGAFSAFGGNTNSNIFTQMRK